MATRADFTDQEWEAMQEGIAGAGMFVALVDRGFFDSFKEANALAITSAKRTSTATASSSGIWRPGTTSRSA